MKRNESLGSNDSKPEGKRLRGTSEVLDPSNGHLGPLPSAPSAQIGSQGIVDVGQALPAASSVYPLMAALADSNTNALLRRESVGAILAAVRERENLECLREALLREEILARLGRQRPLSQWAFAPTPASFLHSSYAPTNRLLGSLLAPSSQSSTSTGAEHEMRALENARLALSPASHQQLGLMGGVDPAVLQSLLRMHLPFEHQRFAGDAASVPAMAAAPNQTMSAGDNAVQKLQANSSTRRRCVDVTLSSDKDSLSDYQCLLREQICFFEATMEDLEASAQGRNKPIRLGQVGIMCRNCLKLAPINRSRGSVYFPARLSGIYQAAQNMAMNHFVESCRHTPKDVKAKLAELKERKSVVFGGGKAYWASGAEIKGVVEDDHGLSLRSDVTREN